MIMNRIAAIAAFLIVYGAAFWIGRQLWPDAPSDAVDSRTSAAGATSSKSGSVSGRAIGPSRTPVVHNTREGNAGAGGSLSEEETANLEAPDEMRAARRAVELAIAEHADALKACVSGHDPVRLHISWSVLTKPSWLQAREPVLSGELPDLECFKRALPDEVEAEPVGETSFPNGYQGPLRTLVSLRMTERDAAAGSE